MFFQAAPPKGGFFVSHGDRSAHPHEVDALPYVPPLETMPRPFSLALGALALVTACTAGRTAPPAAPDPWQEALRFDYAAASDEFARRHSASPDDARLALARASALLGRQPRSQANIEEARAVLERLASRETADPFFRIAARFLLARIAEDHLSPPRPGEARELYESLLREHAGHALAEQAAVRLALMAAYPPPGSPPPRPAEVGARLDELIAAANTPAALRELRALRGRLLLEQGEPSAALPHLRAARAIGYRQPDRDAEADLTIANVARETGDATLAIAHYEAFLHERSRDSRVSTVRRLLAELRASQTATPVSP